MTTYVNPDEAVALKRRLQKYQVPTDDGSLVHDLHHYQNESESNSSTPLLLFIHGFGEHVGMFEKFIFDFQNLMPIDIFHYNQRGHGPKFVTPDRVAKFDMDGFCRDLLTIVEFLNRKFPDRKLFLMGDSMGGTILYTSAMRPPYASEFVAKKIAGVIFENPFIQPHPSQAGFVLKYLVRILGNIFTNQTVPQELDTSNLTNDEAWKEKLINDPLFMYKSTFGTAKNLLESANWVYANLNLWPKSVPYRLNLGDADLLVDNEAAQKFHGLAKSRNSGNGIHIYAGGVHSLKGMSGNVKEEFIENLCSFLNSK